MKHLFHKISLTILSVLFASFLTIAYIPVNAESPSSGITVTITEDDMRAITNSTNATTEIKDIIVTSSGLAVFGYEGIPGSEPRPKLSVVHTSETHGVDTLKFKSTLGNITKIEISAGGVTVGVDVNYQTPAGQSYGEDWATWEGNASELILDGADLYPCIIADPVHSITFTIQPQVEDSMMGVTRVLSPTLSAVILAVLAAGGTIYHFGKSTTPDQLDQTWVNCLNLFGVEYNA